MYFHQPVNILARFYTFDCSNSRFLAHWNFTSSSVFNFSVLAWPSVMTLFADSESAQVAIVTVFSILMIMDIVGNSLVCAIILRNQDMRYVKGFVIFWADNRLYEEI